MQKQKSNSKKQIHRKFKKLRIKRILKRYRVNLYCSILIIVSAILFLGGFNRNSLQIDEFQNELSKLKIDEKTDTFSENSNTIQAETEIKNSSIDTSSWNLVLVNSTHPIPQDFKIDLTNLKNGHSVDSRIYKDLQAMMDAARAEGLSPIICSSYRTMEKQTSLFNKEVNSYLSQGYSQKEAEQKASYWVAIPGTSEHQLGLAVDIVAQSYQGLDKAQEQTDEQKWLMKHCAEYGFILRYPTNKSDITGIGYEPWHYRYVGKEIAKEIMDKGICLEEYLGEV